MISCNGLHDMHHVLTRQVVAKAATEAGRAVTREEVDEVDTTKQGLRWSLRDWPPHSVVVIVLTFSHKNTKLVCEFVC